MDDESQQPDRNFNPIQETDEDLCRALWLSVAIQALIDASGKSGNCIEQSRAKEWLVGRGGMSSDFETVCSLAGIDVSRTRKRILTVIRGSAEPIDFRCMKKAYLKNRSSENRKRYFRRAEKNARLRREKARVRRVTVQSEESDPANAEFRSGMAA